MSPIPAVLLLISTVLFLLTGCSDDSGTPALTGTIVVDAEPVEVAAPWRLDGDLQKAADSNVGFRVARTVE